MRLTEFSPKWIVPAQWAANSDPLYIGLSFTCKCAKCTAGVCPTCGHAPERKRLAVYFWPPIDAHGLFDKYGWDREKMKANWCPGAHQRVSGETFDTLTLAPSVGLDPHFHATITKGEVSQ